ncbi:hypothetical protein O7626_40210 [Micromonospora sp. WMMD1102]|nr:hypothetical protein [Micromonospora sp. WMMD1102]MDG4792042.1 hypothetical protein [Micromonospora sp. WMMD1102]
MPNKRRRQHQTPDQGPWWPVVLLLAIELARLTNTVLVITAA